ncbi:MAG: ABC transporter ATP-binding protein [Thermoproteota archaeon]|nr:ABC transporter ATP-binding protein [Candidatus Brockarchaeota archaeon]
MSLSVEVRELTKVFGDLVAVDHATFSVKRGEIFGLLGPNGAGKSTLFRMLCTVLRPTYGTAKVEGHDILKETNEVRKVIGVVQEKLILYAPLTPIENLTFFGKLYGVEDDVLKRKIEELLQEAKLWEVRDKPVGIFSSGMRQRVNIIRALLHDPKLLMLDEPTNTLDPQSVRWVRDYIKALRDRGLTIILTSHDMYEIDELAEEVAIMDRGKIIAVGGKEELKNKYSTDKFEEVFLALTGRTLRDELSGRLKRRGW